MVRRSQDRSKPHPFSSSALTRSSSYQADSSQPMVQRSVAVVVIVCHTASHSRLSRAHSRLMSAGAVSGLRSARRLCTLSTVLPLSIINESPLPPWGSYQTAACIYLLPTERRQYRRPKRMLWGNKSMRCQDYPATMPVIQAGR